MRDLLGRGLRFGIVGVLATLLHVAVATGCIEGLGFAPWLANAVAFVSATVVSFVGQTLWSFRSQLGVGRFARFVVVAVGGLGLTILISGGLDALGLPYGIGIAAVVMTVPAFTFLMHSFWTYRERPAPRRCAGDLASGE